VFFGRLETLDVLSSSPLSSSPSFANQTNYQQQMERWGNGRARAYFEAEVPSSYARPSDWSNVQQMTKWIRVSRKEGSE